MDCGITSVHSAAIKTPAAKKNMIAVMRSEGLTQRTPIPETRMMLIGKIIQIEIWKSMAGSACLLLGCWLGSTEDKLGI